MFDTNSSLKVLYILLSFCYFYLVSTFSGVLADSHVTQMIQILHFCASPSKYDKITCFAAFISYHIIVAALCTRAGHYIFALWLLLFLLSLYIS